MNRIIAVEVVTGGVLILFEDGNLSYFPSEALHQHRFLLGLQAMTSTDGMRQIQ